jgi:hypothetical protein
LYIGTTTDIAGLFIFLDNAQRDNAGFLFTDFGDAEVGFTKGANIRGKEILKAVLKFLLLQFFIKSLPIFFYFVLNEHSRQSFVIEFVFGERKILLRVTTI